MGSPAPGLKLRVLVAEDEHLAALVVEDALVEQGHEVVLARALGMCLPALAYDIGPASEYPDRFVEKVSFFGADPAERVARAAKRLLADRAGLCAR